MAHSATIEVRMTDECPDGRKSDEKSGRSLRTRGGDECQREGANENRVCG